MIGDELKGAGEIRYVRLLPTYQIQGKVILVRTFFTEMPCFTVYELCAILFACVLYQDMNAVLCFSLLESLLMRTE